MLECGTGYPRVFLRKYNQKRKRSVVVDLITIPSDGEREPRQCSDAVEVAKHLPLSPRSSFFSSFPPIRKGFFSVPFQFSVMKPWIAKARILLQIWTSSLGLGPFKIALWMQQDSSPTFRQSIKNKWDNLKKNLS